MYIRKVHIENIRSIEKLDWEVPAGKEAGWHVLIGDNGAGKSTLLRAIALSIVGVSEWQGLRQSIGVWLRRNCKSGSIAVHPSYTDSELRFPNNEDGTFSYALLKPLEVKLQLKDDEIIYGSPSHFIQATNLPGLGFTAAYGPFRRFSGGDEGSQEIYKSLPRLGAHLSVFGEHFALTEALVWLRSLKFKALENKPEGRLLEHLIAFINQPDFLPHQAKLVEVSSDGVQFEDAEGRQFSVTDLSDGYRSILSLTFELIRQMERVFGHDKIFDPDDASKVIVPGIVLIDEIDAHLHPTWQRRIGFWFREHFPNIQFIVTTHSPLICQAAEVGSIWHLPTPGSGEVMEQVTGDALNRLLYGNVQDAYGTQVFGAEITRSDVAKAHSQRLAELNVREMQAGLSAAELREQDNLRAAMPTTSHEVTPEFALNFTKALLPMAAPMLAKRNGTKKAAKPAATKTSSRKTAKPKAKLKKAK